LTRVISVPFSYSNSIESNGQLGNWIAQVESYPLNNR